MANSHFSFKQFTVHQDACAMKVTTDGCLFGAWVAEALAKKKWSGKALDIGAGTALLSLMVAQQNPIEIDAVEIDANAACQAQENIINNGFTNITLHHSDILTIDLGKYDCIFSNPPFYEKELASPNSDREMAHHGRGLLLTQLIAYITAHLNTDGLFFLLLPAKRIVEVQTLLNEVGLRIYTLVWVKQTPKHPPFRVMLCGGKKMESKVENELLIRKEDGAYSAAFTALLKDYYLYL